MKKLLIGLLGLFVVYMGGVHLWHAVSLDGYLQGCRDTILNAAQNDNVQVSDDAVNDYCQALSQKYVEGK